MTLEKDIAIYLSQLLIATDVAYMHRNDVIITSVLTCRVSVSSSQNMMSMLLTNIS